MSWDGYLHKYLGDVISANDVYGGTAASVGWGWVDVDLAPKCLQCPADTGAKGEWVTTTVSPYPQVNGIRSYAINGVSGEDYNVGSPFKPDASWTLPWMTTYGGQHGVGVSWGSVSDPIAIANARGYPGSVVKDPTGTILFVEQPDGQDGVDNQWPCFSNGTCTPWGPGQQYQILAVNPQPVQAVGSSSGVSQGLMVYKAQKMRFNYNFHDGHVEALDYTKTVGTGTADSPGDGNGVQGMWTLTPND
jgi:hypothetical protein